MDPRDSALQLTECAVIAMSDFGGLERNRAAGEVPMPLKDSVSGRIKSFDDVIGIVVNIME